MTLLAVPRSARAEPLLDPGRASLAVFAGRFNLLSSHPGTTELGFEITLPARDVGTRWGKVHLRPLVGAAVHSRRGFWAYAGVTGEVQLRGRWWLVPSFAAAFFERGSGEALGSRLEFRSGLELAYRIDPRWHLGVLFYHLSNGDFASYNPGSESLVLRLGWRLPPGEQRRRAGAIFARGPSRT
ncbi:MAG: acyloxyacyl hydrolase [Thermoanaerobaculia bacterium]